MSASVRLPTGAWRLLRGIDWSQLWYPGPSRKFSDAELQRAGGGDPGSTFWTVVLVQVLMLAVQVVALVPAPARLPEALILLVWLALTTRLTLALWRRPSRKRYAGCNAVILVATLLILVADKHWPGLDRNSHLWLGLTDGIAFTTGSILLWTLALYRAHQIEGRLRELAERDEALALARRLSAAQLQPHFLFNTLASIQHWVDTGDGRAGPALHSLTGFLRAVLPMFERPLHRLDEEAALIQRYLEVMRQRLGDRLQVRCEWSDGAAAALLPPGLVLTLVENAVEHGVQGSLHGAQVQLSGRLEGGRLAVEVRDDGPGPALPLAEGVGLRNCRERLAQAFGEAARLSVERAGPAGGCVARVELPAPPQDIQNPNPRRRTP
jgi:signal transduction histidine kinase